MKDLQLTNTVQPQNNTPMSNTIGQNDEFYAALQGLALTDTVKPENPTEPDNNTKKMNDYLKSSFIPGTGLIGTGLDNQPVEEQKPFNKVKSNLDYGVPNPVNNNPFDTNANNTQISDLNMGVNNMSNASNNTKPGTFGFGNTDYTNPQPSNNMISNNTPQMVSGQTINPSNVDFTKKHNEQPKNIQGNTLGDYGQDFPKAPDFHLGGTYDWNYYPKLKSADIDGKLAILRKVGI